MPKLDPAVAAYLDSLEPVARRYVKRVKTLRVGNGLDEGVQMGPVITRQSKERVQKLIGVGARDGAGGLPGTWLAALQDREAVERLGRDVGIFDPSDFGYGLPYLDMNMISDVTVTPDALATLRTAKTASQ